MKKINRLIAVLLTIAMMLTILPVFAAADGGDDDGYITVYISLEGFTIGNGFFIEPFAVSIPEGSGVDVPTAMMFDEYGLTTDWFGGWLQRIGGLNYSAIEVPNLIMEGIMREHYSQEMFTLEWAGVGSVDGSLGAGDYSSFAGWMFTVNHELIGIGVDEKFLNNGDVIRWQFSLAAGMDLGVHDWSEPFFWQEDKTALIRELLSEYANPAGVQFALDVAINPFATDGDVRAAFAALRALDWEAAMERALTRIVTHVSAPNFGTTMGEWAILAVARSGFDAPDGWFDGYVDRISARLDGIRETQNPNDTDVSAPQGVPNGNWIYNPATGRREVRFADAQSTENSRLVVALTALGFDASNFTSTVSGYTYDLVARLGNRTDVASSQMWGERQGMNGPIWNLIALNSLGWETPYEISDRDWVGGTTEANPITLDERIDWLLDRENATNGGWALSGTAFDADITGMTIQALAPYYYVNAEVRAVIDRTVTAIAVNQRENGGWGGAGFASGYNVQSTAQIIVGLTALGIDPTRDPRFVTESGNTPISALLSFQDDVTGGFIHPYGGNVNQMATEQATYALVAYWRFRNGMRSLYDIRDAFVGVVKVDAASAQIERAYIRLGESNSAILVVATFNGNGRFTGMGTPIQVNESGWIDVNFDISTGQTWRLMLWSCENLMQPLDNPWPR